MEGVENIGGEGEWGRCNGGTAHICGSKKKAPAAIKSSKQASAAQAIAAAAAPAAASALSAKVAAAVAAAAAAAAAHCQSSQALFFEIVS